MVVREELVRGLSTAGRVLTATGRVLAEEAAIV